MVEAATGSPDGLLGAQDQVLYTPLARNRSAPVWNPLMTRSSMVTSITEMPAGSPRRMWI
jgi:hypothetical protein